jgi:hypothetical protein
VFEPIARCRAVDGINGLTQHATRERDDSIAAGLDAMIRARGNAPQSGAT